LVVRVDVGSGSVSVECFGEGSPVVLFEAGDESVRDQWRRVQPEVAQRTRTCSYDRLGNGVSDVATGCRGTKELRSDLEAVVQAMRLEPPFVLVGTSGGGYLVTNYAYAHPDQVAGIVLAETPRAIQPEQAPAELIAELKCDSSENQEHRDYVSVEGDAWDGRRSLGVPVSVISNDYGAEAEDYERANVEEQKGWLALSKNSRQVVVTSGHNVAENEPAVVLAEINWVLDQVS
jgi:pimeloyl-ACP methyl ester carboxylesterase